MVMKYQYKKIKTGSYSCIICNTMMVSFNYFYREEKCKFVTIFDNSLHKLSIIFLGLSKKKFIILFLLYFFLFIFGTKLADHVVKQFS